MKHSVNNEALEMADNATKEKENIQNNVKAGYGPLDNYMPYCNQKELVIQRELNLPLMMESSSLTSFLS